MIESDPQRHEDPLDAFETEERGIAGRLGAERPHPSVPFREDLRARLSAASGERALAGRLALSLGSGYLAAGVILLLVAVAGVAGIGPFAS